MYKPLKTGFVAVCWLLVLGAVVVAWNYRHIGYEADRQIAAVVACESFAGRGARVGYNTRIYRQRVRLDNDQIVTVEVDWCSEIDNREKIGVIRKKRYLLGTEFFVADESLPVELE